MKNLPGLFRAYMALERKRSGAGLSPEELGRWTELKRRLSRHLTPDVSDEHADQRRSVRVPTRLAVSFSSLGQLVGSLMTNLSRRGLFVATEHLLDIGTRLELRIQIGDTGEVIELPAEVVSHNLGPGFENDSPGMGMSFRDASPGVEKQMAKLYERALQKAAG
jgi:Tfp pilus assembly protein PilZ